MDELSIVDPRLEDYLNDQEVVSLNKFRDNYRRNRVSSNASERSNRLDEGAQNIMWSSKFSGDFSWENVEKNADDEDIIDEYINLPLLTKSNKAKRHAKRSKYAKLLNIIDGILNNTGSLTFIIGSILFYPESTLGFSCGEQYTCVFYGSVFFILGSLLYLFSAVISFMKANAYDALLADGDIDLFVNATLYILADIFFVVGSICFLPAVDKLLHGKFPVG